MSDKKKKNKNKKTHEDISDIVGGRKRKKQNTRKNRHNANQFTKEYSDDIEFTDNFEKFNNNNN